jgi:hypothetical protein
MFDRDVMMRLAGAAPLGGASRRLRRDDIGEVQRFE